MDTMRERALILAHEHEMPLHSPPEMVVKRAEVYLAFLKGVPDQRMAAELLKRAEKERDGSAWMNA